MVLDSLDLINEKFNDNVAAGRINPKVLLPGSNSRKYYATGEAPEFAIPPDFHAAVDSRRKLTKANKLMVGQGEMTSYLKCIPGTSVARNHIVH